MNFTIVCRKALYFRGSLSICPAYAGMIPRNFATVVYPENLSRVCGDDPEGLEELERKAIFVPRMRG